MRKFLVIALFAVFLLISGAFAENKTCEVKINLKWQYNETVNPTIDIKADNESLNFNKYMENNTSLIVRFQGDIQKPFLITIKAPGYQPVTRNFVVDQSGKAVLSVNMNAKESYIIGREITKRASKFLDFKNSDNILVITTAGHVKYKNETTEDAIEGILNELGNSVSFGRGNILLLRKTALDTLDFAFITKKGKNITMAYFRNASFSPVYIGTISENMSMKEYSKLCNSLGKDIAFSIASIANAWALGVSADILREAAFHGHLCAGTICGYAMVETLLKYYPPKGGAMGEGVSYIVLGVPGGSDDDVFVYSMDATPGKRAYIGYNTTNDPNIVGFIRWDSNNKKGTLIVMKYDVKELAEEFKKIYGLNIKEDTPIELKFNSWLVKKLINNPESLVKILYAFDNLTEEQVNYLAGGTSGRTVQSAHGLDMSYILNQTNLVNATPENFMQKKGNLTYDQLKTIGLEAARLAVDIFKQCGINVEKDNLNFLVLTSAGYARLNGQDTSPMWDGIYDILGSRLSRRTLLPVHSALWSPIWFTFILKDGKYNSSILGKIGGFGKFKFNITKDDNLLFAIQIVYDPEKGLVVINDTKGPIYDIGPGWNYTNPSVSKIFKNWNSVVTISNGWSYEPPFDMLMVYLFHNHICPGVSPSYLITNYIFQNFPRGKDEKYIYITTTDYCKDDGILLLLGVSPGAGTYYNLRLSDNDTQSPSINGGNMEGILIIWNEKLNIGKAVIITFKWPQFYPGTNSLKAYIDWYKGKDPKGVASPYILTKETEKYITGDELSVILKGSKYLSSGNVLKFIMELPNRQLSDLISVLPISYPTQVTRPTNVSTLISHVITGSSIFTRIIPYISGLGIPIHESISGISGPSGKVGGEIGARGAAQAAGAAGKAYEITPVSKGIGKPGIPFAGIIAVIILIALIAVGYLLRRPEK